MRSLHHSAFGILTTLAGIAPESPPAQPKVNVPVVTFAIDELAVPASLCGSERRPCSALTEQCYNCAATRTLLTSSVHRSTHDLPAPCSIHCCPDDVLD